MKKWPIGAAAVALIIFAIFTVMHSDDEPEEMEPVVKKYKVYKAKQEKETEDDGLDKKVQAAMQRGIPSARPKPEKTSPPPKDMPSFPHVAGSPGEKVLSEEELEKLDEYFEKVEQEWDNKMKDFFMNELGMPEEDYKDYQRMREGYEEDKVEAFQEFHEYMVEKYGANYSYNPSEDEEHFGKKVLEEYRDILRKKIGEEAYSRYLELLDGQNEKMKREQDPYKGVMVIDL